MALPPLHVVGMHGLGDNLHQRAVIKQLMAQHEAVWLETSWPSVYHDLVAQGLHLIRRPVQLRTQTKNAEREVAKFDSDGPPPRTPSIQIMYHGAEVARSPSDTILEAMCNLARVSYEDADFSLPIPQTWREALYPLLPFGWDNGKPLLIYRPLTERPEWRGGATRNADPDCYTRLFAKIRDRFFVVSVADLEAGREWLLGPVLKPDVVFHKGELVFEQLAALFSVADMVYCSSGFGPILAQAVGTPVISIVGGYHSWKAQRPPPLMAQDMLGIDPAQRLPKWGMSGNKTFDVTAALDQVDDFLASKHLLPSLDAPSQSYSFIYGPDAPRQSPLRPAITPSARTQQMLRERAAVFARANALGGKA